MSRIIVSRKRKDKAYYHYGVGGTISNSPAISPENQLTVEVWIKATHPQQAIQLYGQYTLAFDGYAFNAVLTTSGSGQVIAWGATAGKPNKWYHLAMTYDGSYFRTYVNGSLEATVVVHGTIPQTGNVLNIGTTTSKHTVDELRIWNVARTQAQIRQAMFQHLDEADGLTFSYSFEPGITNVNGSTISLKNDYGSSAYVPSTAPLVFDQTKDERLIPTSIKKGHSGNKVKRLDIEAPYQFPFNADYTITMWAKHEGNYSGQSTLFALGSYGVGFEMNGFDDKVGRFTYGVGTFWLAESVNRKQWNHFVVTYTASTRKTILYLNGRKTGQIDDWADRDSSFFYMSSSEVAFADIRRYSRVLTEVERIDVLQGKEVPTGLELWYKFDEVVVDKAMDSSLHGRHAPSKLGIMYAPSDAPIYVIGRSILKTSLKDPFKMFGGLIEGWYENDLNSMTINAEGKVTQWRDKSGKGRHLGAYTGHTYPNTSYPSYNAETKEIVFESAKNTLLFNAGYSGIYIGAIVAYAMVRNYPSSDLAGIIGGLSDYRFLYGTTGKLHAPKGEPSAPFEDDIWINGVRSIQVPLASYFTISGINNKAYRTVFGDGGLLVGKNFGASDPEGRDGDFNIKGFVILNRFAGLEQLKMFEQYLTSL